MAYNNVSTADSSQWASGLQLSEHALQEPDAELGLGGAINSGGSSNAAAPLNSGDSSSQASLPPSKHKVATLFHYLFKVSALLMYLFCSLFFDNFILVFVVCVLLLAFDFWTVKNVTGRLLVGLRWWNEVREDGSNVWIFESQPATREIHPTDSRMFWVGIYATPVVWFVFGIGALTGLRFQWLLIVAVALVLSGANVIGYWKCSKDAGQKIRSFVTSQVLSHAVPGGATFV